MNKINKSVPASFPDFNSEMNDLLVHLADLYRAAKFVETLDINDTIKLRLIDNVANEIKFISVQLDNRAENQNV
jgi:hypothetical protein